VLIGCILQVGVATVAAAVQRAGGSTAHPGDVLDKALEQKAAYIEGGAGPEVSSLGAQ
jgi:zinc protease